MRRFARILSIALITAGLVTAADVAITLAYQEPISSLYGDIQQQQAVDQLNALNSSSAQVADFAATKKVLSPRARALILARRFSSRLIDGQAIGRIRVPAMGGLNSVVVQGTGTSDLQKGPGHYPTTSLPGEAGTVAIAGHRTTYAAPFNKINEIAKGDRITLEMPYGTFIYTVTGTAIVDPSDVSVVDGVGHPQLVLSACHPLYSAAQRYIVFARLSHIAIPGSG